MGVTKRLVMTRRSIAGGERGPEDSLWRMALYSHCDQSGEMVATSRIAYHELVEHPKESRWRRLKFARESGRYDFTHSLRVCLPITRQRGAHMRNRFDGEPCVLLPGGRIREIQRNFGENVARAMHQHGLDANLIAGWRRPLQPEVVFVGHQIDFSA